MASLLTIYQGGAVVGRCDAKCYLATTAGCRCICDGMNHSAGLHKATDQTRTLAGQWMDRARAAGQRINSFDLDLTARQDPLF